MRFDDSNVLLEIVTNMASTSTKRFTDSNAPTRLPKSCDTNRSYQII